MKILIILLMLCCAALSFLAIVQTMQLRKLQNKVKKKFYHTPRLSDLHGKQFADYMDYLTEGLK